MMASKKILVVVVLILILGVIVGGGVLAYRSLQNKPKVAIPSLKPTPTEVQTSTPTPTATPTPVELDLSDYSVQVINGSGVVGQAGKIQNLLEEKGTKNVETKNADSFDHASTEIRFKKTVSEKLFTKLKEILIDFTVVKGEALPNSSVYDIVIILGTEKTAQ